MATGRAEEAALPGPGVGVWADSRPGFAASRPSAVTTPSATIQRRSGPMALPLLLTYPDAAASRRWLGATTRAGCGPRRAPDRAADGPVRAARRRGSSRRPTGPPLAIGPRLAHAS